MWTYTQYIKCNKNFDFFTVTALKCYQCGVLQNELCEQVEGGLPEPEECESKEYGYNYYCVTEQLTAGE